MTNVTEQPTKLPMRELTEAEIEAVAGGTPACEPGHGTSTALPPYSPVGQLIALDEGGLELPRESRTAALYPTIWPPIPMRRPTSSSRS